MFRNAIHIFLHNAKRPTNPIDRHLATPGVALSVMKKFTKTKVDLLNGVKTQKLLIFSLCRNPNLLETKYSLYVVARKQNLWFVSSLLPMCL